MSNIRQNLWRLARTLLGLGAGALITSFIVALLVGKTILDDPESHVPAYWSTGLTATLIVLMFAVPVGLIGHMVLYGLKRRKLICYAGLATISGMLFALITLHDDPNEWINLFVYGPWAGACGAIAWFIRRPDKDEPKTPDPASHF